jgi:hypothetical protein
VLDQRPLERVQVTRDSYILHREQRSAVEHRHRQKAGVGRVDMGAGGRALDEDDRAGAAVALVAAFLGARAALPLSQPVKHAQGRRRVGQLANLASKPEAEAIAILPCVS